MLFFFCFIVLFEGLKNPNVYKPKLQKEKSLSQFEARDFYSNKRISSLDIFSDNNFYLINIWASWCIPCRVEHSYLVKLKKQNSIKLVGINYKDNFENAKKFLNEFENPYSEILKDKDGTLSIQLGAYGVPETFIVNKRKKIIKKIIGPIDQKTYNEVLKIIQ
ncbi:MAG: DsbE family thiol:disulfide interchange protein [Pelagibacterales bacterium]|nr:DsbE family thiol:disulfide interchange protein [Pelagibacterales bacterium]